MESSIGLRTFTVSHTEKGVTGPEYLALGDPRALCQLLPFPVCPTFTRSSTAKRGYVSVTLFTSEGCVPTSPQQTSLRWLGQPREQ